MENKGFKGQALTEHAGENRIPWGLPGKQSLQMQSPFAFTNVFPEALLYIYLQAEYILCNSLAGPCLFTEAFKPSSPPLFSTFMAGSGNSKPTDVNYCISLRKIP